MSKEQKGPVRVLQVLGGTGLGGAESRVMDSYRHLDRSRIQFDFCVHSQQEGFFDKEIESLGGHVYRVPRFRVTNWIEYRRAWKAFFREHPGYAAVHGHMTSTASIYLPIAKAAGVPLTIAHARSAGVDPGLKGAMTRFLRRNLGKKADVCLTCSRLAGEAVFGEKMVKEGRVITVPNAIDAKEFAFSEQVRQRKRSELGIGEQEFVIGHVGRFGHMKNHAFLLDVFAQLHKRLPDSRLLLVGEGGLMDSIREKATALGLSGRVIFAGNQAKVADYYMAMDFFVFPSIFEGLPGSVIEAQAAGLRCLVSDSVTDEVLITPLAQALPLSDGAAAWAGNVLERSGSENSAQSPGAYRRKQMAQAIKDAGFDVSDQVRFLEGLYLGRETADRTRK
ncbi:MAG TPA: glycosyltransferase family 1 protein [Candidatus Eisenbergiella intestinipullorum]|nr:glycosyltransferase family 1 protein [Candidatus Eisenbergiella intestinipullorum]